MQTLFQFPPFIRRALLAVVTLIVAGVSLFTFIGSHAVHKTLSTPPSSKRVDLSLNSAWRFHRGDTNGAQNTLFDDSSWTRLDLPYTWNKLDGQNGSDYYQGIAWYRKHYTVNSSYAGREFFLQFDGSNLVTTVYVNGHLVGEHRGGYSTFRFDVTPFLTLGNDNVFAVKVTNAYNKDVVPISYDFTIFGGIYRTVHLVVTDKLHIQMLDYGAPGVYLQQFNVSDTRADVQITVKTENDNDTAQHVTLTSVIVDADNNIVMTLTSSQTEAARTGYDFVQRTTIPDPHLWDGQKDPYLYHVYAQLREGGTVTDLVTQPLGLRFFRLDPNQGFFLNGHYLDLHGINMHQDRLNKGWAVSQSDLDEDFSFIKEIGANAIRLAHYPHNQHVYDLSDSNGIVVWTEIPLIDTVTTSTAFTENVEQQLIELIRQNYNHPSVIFWGIANEIQYPPDPNPLLDQLNTLAHKEDPSRLTTVAICCVDDMDRIVQHTDTRGYNEYYGWYGGSIGDLDSWARDYHHNHPNTSFAVSEYGAGASIYQHQDNPRPPVDADYYHPEEYQATLHEEAWKSMATKPYIWGKFVWSLFDFASAGRDEGDTAGQNDKGLVTYDRRTRKDAFYWYKANWSSSPFVYITDRRYTNRNSATTDIKIYSNTSSVELKLNGISLGSKSSADHIFTWRGITLAPGKNTVQAIGSQDGNTFTDAVTWQFIGSDRRLDVGARRPYIDSRQRFFDVDHYYSGGLAAVTQNHVALTTDESEYQTFRFGTFTYTIPLPNGTYTLLLRFMEPSKTSCGQRLFNVSANGTPLLKNEDIYCEVGQNTALQKAFTLTVSNGTLNLAFKPSVGNAIVSAIVLMKQE